jgi:hypothetical protein
VAIERTERIRQQLEQQVGEETATYLMDRPPGGWSELVTRDVLDDKIDVLRHEMRVTHHELSAEIQRLGNMKFEILAEVERRFRIQTWTMASALITGLGVVGAILRI